AEILGPEEVTVGEEEEIIITLQNSPYSNGNVHITGPSGKPYMAYTDENGKLTVPFDMVGNYTIELLVDGHLLKAKSIESLSVIVEPEEKSWLIQWWESDVGRGISLLFLLLAVFIAYYFLSGKTKKKKNGNGKKYRKP
ncbi:hypothetical protein JXB01_04850, partial [Candidatus Micrarchaeota archaeon]|nr:hypothetical protein [Candidatus Micrarchaeota archaeon]